jgi:hypothetical protein
MEAIFNGTITHDKFCMSRMKQFQIAPARKLEAREVSYPSETTRGERLSEEETNEKTAVEYSAKHHQANRRQAAVGSSLAVSCSMECDATTSEANRPLSPGEQR